MMYYVCNFTVHICLWNTPDSFAATDPSAAFSDPSILFWHIEFSSKIVTAWFLALQITANHTPENPTGWNSWSHEFLKESLPQQKHSLQIYFFSHPNYFKSKPSQLIQPPVGRSIHRRSWSPGRLPSRSNTSPLASVCLVGTAKKKQPGPVLVYRGICFWGWNNTYPVMWGFFHKHS